MHGPLPRVQFHEPVIHAGKDALQLVAGRKAVFFPDETPKVGQRANGDVETAFRRFGNLLSRGDNAEEIRRNSQRSGGGARVEPTQFAVRTMNAHERVHPAKLIECGRDDRDALSAGGRVNRDRDKRAEQGFAAADQLKAGLRGCSAARYQEQAQDAGPAQT